MAAGRFTKSGTEGVYSGVIGPGIGARSHEGE